MAEWGSVKGMVSTVVDGVVSVEVGLGRLMGTCGKEDKGVAFSCTWYK